MCHGMSRRGVQVPQSEKRDVPTRAVSAIRGGLNVKANTSPNADAGRWKNAYVRVESQPSSVTEKRMHVMKAGSDLGITSIRCFVHTLRQRVREVIIAQHNQRELLAII